jgi:hypothetical protein
MPKNKFQVSPVVYVVIASIIIISNSANLTSLTGNMGELISRNMDNRVYCSTVVTILDNFYNGNFTDAFSAQNFGYGFGYFIILAILTGPFHWSGNDFGFSTSLMMANILGFILIVCLSVYLYSKLRDSISNMTETRGRVFEIYLISLFMCALPSANYVLRNLRPEVWQAVFFLISIISYITYHDSKKLFHLVTASICMGLAVGIKVSLATVALAFGLFIVFDNLKRKQIVNIIIFCFFSSLSCGLFVNPNLFANPVDAAYFILSEIKMAAGMLKLDIIADMNYCFPLSSRWNAILAWITYPYITAYVGLPFLICGLVAFMLFITYFSDRKSKLINVSTHVITSLELRMPACSLWRNLQQISENLFAKKT